MLVGENVPDDATPHPFGGHDLNSEAMAGASAAETVTLMSEKPAEASGWHESGRGQLTCTERDQAAPHIFDIPWIWKELHSELGVKHVHFFDFHVRTDINAVNEEVLQAVSGG